MKSIKLSKNPFVIFLPFLLFYIAFIVLLYNKVLWGDEIRHLDYAQNLFHGFYSDPAPNIRLDIGPGYPLFILIFLSLNLPLIGVSLMNGVFNYLAVVFLFKALQHIAPFKTTLLFSLFLACYFNSLEYIAIMYSESMALFLVSLLVLLLVKAFSNENSLKIKNQKFIYFSGIVFGYLALTKIIFGYVLLCMIIGSLFLWALNRKSINYRKSVFILLIGLAVTSPYLIYTYHITGKVFYWGTTGGNNLYWMSTPYKGEYGNWIPNPDLQTIDTTSSLNHIEHAERGGLINIKNRHNYTPGGEDSIELHHIKDFEEINKYRGVERDEFFKKMVTNNIKTHPFKYIQNCFSNVGRILFNYPYSYTYQKPSTLLRFPLNGIIVVLMLFCLLPTFINWKKIIFPVRFMLFFALLYFGGSIFGSAEIRMFTVVVPVLLFWIAYIIQKSMKIKIKFDDKINE